MKMSDVKWIVVALMLVAAPRASAQSSGAPQGPEGIKVSGHWTIDVREPDGTLVKSHEFNNALTNNGHVLVRLMARQNSAGQWYVILQGTASLPSPCGTAAQQQACALQEPGDLNNYSGTTKFPALSVSTDAAFPTKLILTGTFTAEVTGHISTVQSANGLCANTVASQSPCASGSGFPLTRHNFVPNEPPPTGPSPVAAGQIVQVRVEITFS